MQGMAVFSEKIEMEEAGFFRKNEKRLAREQRKLSRCVRGSHNYELQKKKVARCHEKIRNQRRDHLHKLSRKIADSYDAVAVEDIDMKAMGQCLHFGKSVQDNGYGLFREMLDYKLAWQGKKMVKVDRFFPSSKKCCKCGRIKKELKLSERVYHCECGNKMDRDHNSAINIREEARSPPLQNQGFKWWEHVTEIWAVATNKYIEGTFPNGVQYDMTSAIQLMHNMMAAHAKAVIAYKEAGYEGKIGIVHSLESKYPYDETKDEDVKAAKNEDVLNNQFLLDATFLGEYRDETMEIINRLVELNNGSFHASKDDMEILKKAASYNDYLGINYYQSRFIRHYDGENDIFHNGTGEKGTSRFCLKGVGERMDKEGIPKTDWYREVSKTKEL